MAGRAAALPDQPTGRQTDGKAGVGISLDRSIEHRQRPRWLPNSISEKPMRAIRWARVDAVVLATLLLATAQATEAQVLLPAARVETKSSARAGRQVPQAAPLQPLQPTPTSTPTEIQIITGINALQQQVAAWTAAETQEETADPCEKILGDKKTVGFFPIRSDSQANCFWGQKSGLAPLKFASLSGSGDHATAYLELLSENFGPVRIGAAGSVSKTKKDSTSTTSDVEQFLGAGGNLVLNVAYPFLRQVSRHVSLVGLVAPRVGTSLPALGGSDRDQAGLLDFGGELQATATGGDKGLALFGQLRVSQTWASDTFYKELGLPNNAGSFGYSNLSLGVVIQDAFVITWTRTMSGPPALREEKNRVSVTVRTPAKS